MKFGNCRYASVDGECSCCKPGVDVGIPMLLTCPACLYRHVDAGKFVTKPHHTHACQHCGAVWRPAILYTVGVQFLPGFKDANRFED